MTHASPGLKHHLCAKALQIHVPGPNLSSELQTHIYISSCLSVSTSMSGIRNSLCPKHLLWAKLAPPQACPLPSNHTTRCSARNPALLQLPLPPSLLPLQPSNPSASPDNFILVSPSVFPSSTVTPIPHHYVSPGLTKQLPQMTCSLLLTSINLVVIFCLKPFHWFSLHLEVKSKLLAWPCISGPFYLSVLSPTTLSLTCQLPTTSAT